MRTKYIILAIAALLILAGAWLGAELSETMDSFAARRDTHISEASK